MSGDHNTDPPTVIGAYRHWCKIRWPDGRVETVNRETARRLGAVETKETT